MKLSVNYLKNNFELVKNIVGINPDLIFTVKPEKKEVWIKSGFFSLDVVSFDDDLWPKALNVIREETRTRPDPNDRSEDWETVNEHSVYDFDVENSLLKVREDGQGQERQKKIINQRKLNELADFRGVPRYLAELFLEEISVSTNSANKHLRETAAVLGLIPTQGVVK